MVSVFLKESFIVAGWRREFDMPRAEDAVIAGPSNFTAVSTAWVCFDPTAAQRIAELHAGDDALHFPENLFAAVSTRSMIASELSLRISRGLNIDQDALGVGRSRASFHFVV